jgi:hypothetical protein
MGTDSNIYKWLTYVFTGEMRRQNLSVLSLYRRVPVCYPGNKYFQRKQLNEKEKEKMLIKESVPNCISMHEAMTSVRPIRASNSARRSSPPSEVTLPPLKSSEISLSIGRESRERIEYDECDCVVNFGALLVFVCLVTNFIRGASLFSLVVLPMFFRYL